MKQVVQNLNTGISTIAEVPIPSVEEGHVLIKTTCSLISSGTERMVVDFARSSLLQKAIKQPERVSDVFNKARIDGPLTAYAAVQSKLQEPMPLGYCNVGTVVDTCPTVTDLSVGDRVLSNGCHAEFVSVPRNLCALIPDDVDDEDAVFTVLSSIALQGIRLSNPTFGEVYVVSGLGLIGLLTCQLLKANGCEVIGIDPDPVKCTLSEDFGVISFHLSPDSDFHSFINNFTNNIGADAFVVTASTSSSDPMHLAARSLRKRGRIILVGVTGLDLKRELLYEKELSFQVSCSYGPGRYDPEYELLGNDYPIGFVRWTENRNFQACLRAMSNNSLSCSPLISSRFEINDASSAYDTLISSPSSLGILLKYPDSSLTLDSSGSRTLSLTPDSISRPVIQPGLSFIGVGSYASSVLIPAFSKAGAEFDTLSSRRGFTPSFVGRRFGFKSVTTDIDCLFSPGSSPTLVISTRHNSHASLVSRALKAGKNVFVEKPLCLTLAELEEIESLTLESRSTLMVGFNRRFSPLVTSLRGYLSNTPKSFVYTINSGQLPDAHWLNDPLVGGGRLLGEACHFVDLLRFLTSSPILDIQILSRPLTGPLDRPQTFILSISFADGSVGSINYYSNGTKYFPKERLEIFSSGRIFRIDNFRKLSAWGVDGFKTKRLWSQDKGQLACCSSFLESLSKAGPPPIPLQEIFEVQRALLKLLPS